MQFYNKYKRHNIMWDKKKVINSAARYITHAKVYQLTVIKLHLVYKFPSKKLCNGQSNVYISRKKYLKYVAFMHCF